MQWRSSDGLIEYYQDAIKLGKEAKSKGIHFPSNGALILGQELDGYISKFDQRQAFQGSLAGLNFWNFFLDADLIQGMSAGVSNVNGNLLQWRNVRKHAIHGDVHIMDISEAEIPGTKYILRFLNTTVEIFFNLGSRISLLDIFINCH